MYHQPLGPMARQSGLLRGADGAEVLLSTALEISRLLKSAPEIAAGPAGSRSQCVALDEVCSLITPGQVKSKARVSEFCRLTRFCEDVRFAIFVFGRSAERKHGVTVTTRSSIDRVCAAGTAFPFSRNSQLLAISAEFSAYK